MYEKRRTDVNHRNVSEFQVFNRGSVHAFNRNTGKARIGNFYVFRDDIEKPSVGFGSEFNRIATASYRAVLNGYVFTDSVPVQRIGRFEYNSVVARFHAAILYNDVFTVIRRYTVDIGFYVKTDYFNVFAPREIDGKVCAVIHRKIFQFDVFTVFERDALSPAMRHIPNVFFIPYRTHIDLARAFYRYIFGVFADKQRTMKTRMRSILIKRIIDFFVPVVIIEILASENFTPDFKSQRNSAFQIYSR